MLTSRLLMAILFIYFIVGFTKKKCKNQIQKTSYAQSQQVCQIWKKVTEIMTQEVQTNDLKEVVNKWIPDTIRKDLKRRLAGLFIHSMMSLLKCKNAEEAQV
uniref:Uncharacterized protein n=2 Tax=Canis lupus familiaris TaxID=9615 RepID=A0A8P0TPX7_CANLF